MTMMTRLGAVLCVLILTACSDDPMEACMKKGLGSLAADGKVIDDQRSYK